MKARLPKTDISNGKNLSRDKETTDRIVLVAVKNGKFQEVVDARFYMGRSASASVVYCSIWVRASGRYISGHGSAGGCGYHKSSAALQDALNSAGITLHGSPYDHADDEKTPAQKRRQCHIGGCGDSSMQSAILAIGRALGFRKMHLVK